jgi:hypothetical protein
MASPDRIANVDVMKFDGRKLLNIKHDVTKMVVGIWVVEIEPSAGFTIFRCRKEPDEDTTSDDGRQKN